MGSASPSWLAAVRSSDESGLGGVSVKDGDEGCVDEVDDLFEGGYSRSQCDDCRCYSLLEGDGYNVWMMKAASSIPVSELGLARQVCIVLLNWWSL